MGRTSGAARPQDAPRDPSSNWVDYFTGHLERLGLSNAELARTTGLGDSVISKWRRGAAVPDVESCRKIARAFHRPLLEVLVAAGHLEPGEARLPAPEAPQKLSPDEERLERLKRVFDDPKTPEPVRDRLRSLLDIAEALGENSGRSG